TWGNLRGVKEAGRMFALPTFFFIGMMGVLFAVGLFRFFTGGIHPIPTFPHKELRYVGLFVILKAFASGGAAVTGVEAISNGVPAFKPPEWRNARTTLMWMGCLLGAMFLHGIIALAAVASVLVIVFKASVSALIPLYAIGVFTSFTFSQAGMAVHHIRLKEPGWRTGMFINGLGAFVSGVMTVIIAAVKFTQGAWVILIAIPLMLSGLLRVHHHYPASGRTLRDPRRRPPLDSPPPRVIIPVLRGRGDDRRRPPAVAYAHRAF